MAKESVVAVAVVLTGCEVKGKAKSGVLSDKEAKALVEAALISMAPPAANVEHWEVKTLTRHLAARARHAAVLRGRANNAAKAKAKKAKAKPKRRK